MAFGNWCGLPDMAYVVASEVTSQVGGSTFTQEIPAGHQTNDLLLAIIYQDGGATAFSNVTSGWTIWAGTAQAAQNAQRTHFAYKIAASSSEADFSIDGTADDWAVNMLVIRGADTTTPIRHALRTDTGSANSTPQSGALTTTANNLLMIYALGMDGSSTLLVPQTPGDLFPLGKVIAGAGDGCLITGYRNQLTSGAAAQVTFLVPLTTEGGSFWTLAIEDGGTGEMGPDCRNSYSVIMHGGAFALNHGPTMGALTAIAGLTSATIDALGVNSTAPTTSGSQSVSTSGIWNPQAVVTAAGGLQYSWTVNLGADAWVGMSHTVSLNMSGNVFGCRFGLSSYGTPSGAKGMMVVFEDNAGAWVAFRLSQIAGMSGVSNSTYYKLIDVSGGVQLGSGGGSINWANIVRIGYGFHRVAGSALARFLYINDVYLYDRNIIVGGCAEAPADIVAANTAMTLWSNEPLSQVQGSAQVLGKGRLQFGDGSTKTYVDLTATAFEFPKEYAASSIIRRLWNAGAQGVEYRIKAASTDTFKLTSAVAATSTDQKFVLDAASSASASYDFSGLVIVGWTVDLLASGVTVNGATMSRSRAITLSGPTLSECVVSNSIATAAVIAADPSKISSCRFISSGTGHAIQLTTPGTYTFAGNTFSGYGIAGSADAAIYNNSGGAVTLNITGGGGTPTVRNGTSATTTINNNVTVTLTNLVVGSAIRVELASGGTLVEFRTAASSSEAFAVAASTAYRVKVRKASSAPYYKAYETLTTPTADTSIYVSQIADS